MLLLVLVVHGIRAFYVPFHMAHEEHVGPFGRPLSHDHAPVSERAHGHHDHEDHGPPHPVADHLGDFIAYRAPSPHESVELVAFLDTTSWTLPADPVNAKTPASLPRTSRSHPGLIPRPRGPPTSV